MDSHQITQLRYELCNRLYVLADEAISIADAWWATDPDLPKFHSQRSGVTEPPDPYEDPPLDDDIPW